MTRKVYVILDIKDKCNYGITIILNCSEKDLKSAVNERIFELYGDRAKVISYEEIYKNKFDVELKIGNRLRNRNSRILYKIIDIFYYKDTLSRGYVLKDTWSVYSEPIMVSEEYIKLEYEYINNF